MKTTTRISIDTESLDLIELNRLAQESQGENGASVIFTGNVRISGEQKGLVGMSLEHYPAMTESQLQKIIDNAFKRWNLSKVIVSHRVGYLTAGETIVFVAVCGLHRKEAFEAAQFVMDYLKRDATFWKKEHFLINGVKSENWVEAKQSDLESIKRWEA